MLIQTICFREIYFLCPKKQIKKSNSCLKDLINYKTQDTLITQNTFGKTDTEWEWVTCRSVIECLLEKHLYKFRSTEKKYIFIEVEFWIHIFPKIWEAIIALKKARLHFDATIYSLIFMIFFSFWLSIDFDFYFWLKRERNRVIQRL